MLGTTAFGGGGVTVWGCVSFDCQLDLHVLDGNLTGQKYRDNVLVPMELSEQPLAVINVVQFGLYVA
jgi:hypothetical protein